MHWVVGSWIMWMMKVWILKWCELKYVVSRFVCYTHMFFLCYHNSPQAFLTCSWSSVQNDRLSGHPANLPHKQTQMPLPVPATLSTPSSCRQFVWKHLSQSAATAIRQQTSQSLPAAAAAAAAFQLARCPTIQPVSPVTAAVDPKPGPAHGPQSAPLAWPSVGGEEGSQQHAAVSRPTLPLRQQHLMKKHLVWIQGILSFREV